MQLNVGGAAWEVMQGAPGQDLKGWAALRQEGHEVAAKQCVEEMVCHGESHAGRVRMEKGSHEEAAVSQREFSHAAYNDVAATQCVVRILPCSLVQ